MDLSIIIPVFNEEENIEHLYKKLIVSLNRLKKSYEIIFIDDGSTDRTGSLIKRLTEKDKNVRLLQFGRNLGKSAALNSGFKSAGGKLIITMDGDLQDEPNEIPKLLEKQEEGYDLVVGWKRDRKDPLSKRIPSKFFNWLTGKLTGTKVHDSNCCFKILTSDLARNINIYGELHRYIPSLAYWKGYRITEVPVKHNPRLYGRSKYGVSRLIKGGLDLITIKFLMKYGKRPMHLFGSIGFVTMVLGIIINLYILYIKVFLLSPIGDRPLLLLGVLLVVVGIQFISIGLIGELITNSNNSRGSG